MTFHQRHMHTYIDASVVAYTRPYASTYMQNMTWHGSQAVLQAHIPYQDREEHVQRVVLNSGDLLTMEVAWQI